MAMLLLRGWEGINCREVEILVDSGPLVIANAWNWGSDHVRPELYRIYHRRSGLPVGPHYAVLTLAQKAMKTAMAAIPDAKRIWGEDVPHFHENRWIREWVLKNLGKNGDLVGGTWVDEKGNEVHD